MSSDWKLSFNSGGRLLPNAHLISNDGLFSIAFFNSHIRVYSIQTRLPIKSINLPFDISDKIADTFVSLKNKNIVYVFTNDNQLFLINWKENLVEPIVNHYNLNVDKNTHGTVNKFIKFTNTDEDEFIIITEDSKNNVIPSTKHLLKVSLLKDDSNSNLISSFENILLFQSSINRNNIVFLNSSTHTLYVASFDEDNQLIKYTLAYPHKSTITTLAISSNVQDPIIALGTSTGVIQLLFDIKNDSSVTQRLLKWHIDQVKSISFNNDDSYLLSGGLEKVLVFWNLENEKQQFLPRFNGPITSILFNHLHSEFIGITLSLDNESSEFQHLILSTIDLTSRVDINGPRPSYNTSLSTLSKDKKKILKQQKNETNNNGEENDSKFINNNFDKVKHDFNTKFKIHPINKQLYFPNGHLLQVYDLLKNDQIQIISAASALQAGKVKSEISIKDPKIQTFEFSSDGNWMITYDTLTTPELDNLLSSNDVSHSLKFWKFDSNSNNWELSTKIIDPHGKSVPITSITKAPSTFFKGHAFVTTDNKGGVRLWRPRYPKDVYVRASQQLKSNKLQQTAWTLRKVYPGEGSIGNDLTNCYSSWCPDGSILAIGIGNSVKLIDIDSFDLISIDKLELNLESRITGLKWSINGDVLLITTKLKIVAVNLLNGECIWGINLPGSGKNLDVNFDGNLIVISNNYYNKTGDINCRIGVWKIEENNQVNCIWLNDCKFGISSIEWCESVNKWILVDLNSRLGVLSNSGDWGVTIKDEEGWVVSSLLGNARVLAGVNKSKKINEEEDEDIEIDLDNGRRGLEETVFNGVLESLEGLNVDVLFDRVMKVL